MEGSKNFARVFTGIFATAIVMILVTFFFFKIARNHYANETANKFMKPLGAVLKGNDFTYDKLEVTYVRNIYAGMNRVHFRATNLKHPNLGSADIAELSAKFKDNAGGNYYFQDFSIHNPDHMRVIDWLRNSP